VLFLILLVGTTLEILAEHTRAAYRLNRWRKNLQGHTIVCGYGTKGRSAIQTLLAQGGDADKIVVIETDADSRARATAAGLAVVVGSASTQDVLEEAGVRDSAAVIIAVNRDDSAVLVSLTVREMAPDVVIIAAVREEENVHLLRQSGADTVITSSAAAGRLLGLATHTPDIAEVLEDLLSVGEGLDIVESVVEAKDVGALSAIRAPGPVIAVVRRGEILRFDDERASTLEEGDRLVTLRSHPGL
jgi:voltage-gated potassium channel